MNRYRFALFGALFLIAISAGAATYPPGSADAVAATAGRWSLIDTVTGLRLRDHVTWDMPDGSAPVDLDPRYVWVLEIRHEPPAIDTRFASIPAQCPVAVDLESHERVTTCAAVVRPAAELKGSVENVAQARIAEALRQLGLRDPADQIRAIALLQAARGGAVLSSDQEAWLSSVASAGTDQIDQVRAVQSSLDAWIDEHPGEIPDVSCAVWPRLPSGECEIQSAAGSEE